ncbi:Detected protein of unknown function [Hibiscus syriacus]|uniref:Transmembrane protein n=1 Tax=Hibiscus syriacus TaxID=106335 RepID=A0A6A2ZIK3_HIBSY|nr:uncharacterized protein LOC120143918 [Hibiscus syriacus]KAE8691854.1 Detected protein of unknown function [Hibiscus syriacus]
MSDTESEIRDHNQQQNKPTKSSSSCIVLALFSGSLRIFFRNKHIFLSIFIFLALPLSFLIFSLSFTSRPLKRHILHLESAALLTATNFESGHLLNESREESISLLRLKLLYSFPSSVFSLLSFISAVHVASVSAPQRPSFLSTASAIRLAWKRVVVTSICSYSLFFLYIQLPRLFATALRDYPRVSLAILVVGSGLEVYLMGVLGLGLVVSALEEKFGWEAICIGSVLMAGRKFCWWLVTCMLVGVSGWIGNRFENLTDGEDYVKSGVWTVFMGWKTAALFWFYAVLVIWSCIVTTIFYSDCKKELSAGVNQRSRYSDISCTE